MTDIFRDVQFPEIVRQAMRRTESEPVPQRMVWSGKLRELGEVVLDLYRRGLLEATSETDALRQACEHFERPQGGRIDPRALLQNTRNARDKRSGRL